MTNPPSEQDNKMDPFLAAYFGNTKTASAPETQPDAPDAEKIAMVETFAKIAAAQGIDLEQLTPQQVEFLWNRTFEKSASAPAAQEAPKVAEAPPPFAKKDDGDEDDKKKHEDAKKEHEEKKEAQVKLAEAEYLGKVMAHSMVAELRKIAEANETPAEPAPEAETQAKEAAMPPQLAKALGKAKSGVEHVGKKVIEKTTGVGAGGESHRRARQIVGGATVGAGAAAAGGAAAAAKKHHDKSKKASALDELAAARAMEMVAENGTYDLDAAAQKIASVLENIEESVKIASIDSYKDALDVRALEILEAAEFPVTWNEQA